MPLFSKSTEDTPTFPDPTPELAMEIYQKLLDAEGNVSQVFSQNSGSYRFKWIEYVYRDALRLEREIIAYVQANPDTTAIEASSAVSSEWLDTTTVGQDVVIYNPTYDESRTFSEFKQAMQSAV